MVGTSLAGLLIICAVMVVGLAVRLLGGLAPAL
jgi:hypothetical protein